MLLLGGGRLRRRGRANRRPGAGPFPVTVVNCGAEVTFEQPPERVVVFKSWAVPFLLGRARPGDRAGRRFPTEYFDAATRRLEEVPLLTERWPAAGREISQEVVLARIPTWSSAHRQPLSGGPRPSASRRSRSRPAAGGGGRPDFQDIDTLFGLYADVFDRQEAADRRWPRSTARFRRRSVVRPARTAHRGLVYPSTSAAAPSTPTARPSMNHALLEPAGFDNVFADIPDRTYEVSVEALLDRDPDVLVLSQRRTSTVTAAITALPGAGHDRGTGRKPDAAVVRVQLPASPIPRGLTRIVERFQK